MSVSDTSSLCQALESGSPGLPISNQCTEPQCGLGSCTSPSWGPPPTQEALVSPQRVKMEIKPLKEKHLLAYCMTAFILTVLHQVTKPAPRKSCCMKLFLPILHASITISINGHLPAGHSSQQVLKKRKQAGYLAWAVQAEGPPSGVISTMVSCYCLILSVWGPSSIITHSTLSAESIVSIKS